MKDYITFTSQFVARFPQSDELDDQIKDLKITRDALMGPILQYSIREQTVESAINMRDLYDAYRLNYLNGVKHPFKATMSAAAAQLNDLSKQAVLKAQLGLMKDTPLQDENEIPDETEYDEDREEDAEEARQQDKEDQEKEKAQADPFDLLR